MKWYFVDLLACPVCKASGEKLLVYPIEEVEEEPPPDIEKIKCKYYCSYKRTKPENVPLEVCKECARKRIRAGVIVCLNCGRWYPIIDEIPVMLDDEYRDMKVYNRFAKKYLARIPENVKKTMKIPSLNELSL